MKFTKEGFVKIIVGDYPGEQDGIENIVFTVQDMGVGIKQENLKKIFEDFKKVDFGRKRGVEGIGLDWGFHFEISCPADERKN